MKMLGRLTVAAPPADSKAQVSLRRTLRTLFVIELVLSEQHIEEY